MAKPAVLLPKLGPALAALGVVGVIVSGFLAVWVFAGNMKVGRALLVTLLGDGFKLTSDLLQADSHLPYYRIFAWDGMRYAFFLSAGIVPLSLLAAKLAWRAIKLARTQPVEYGGLKMARTALALSGLLFATFSAAGLDGLPGAIERGRARHTAATRALMYEHAQALRQYYREYGTFPREAADLARLGVRQAPASDYWEQQFKYAPFGTVAARNSALGFSNYTLISAGPDGDFGTSDDIVMLDGAVVDKPSDANLPASLLAPEKKKARR